MFTKADDDLSLGIDCLASLGPGRVLIQGWAAAPRGIETGLGVSSGPADCPIEHAGFHPRPDVAPAGAAPVNGFTLLVAAPAAPAPLGLTLTAGRRALDIDLRDRAIPTDLTRATANRALIAAAAEDPALAALLAREGRPLGALADWLARLPRPRESQLLAAAEALATPAGEVLVTLRAHHPPAAGALIEAAALATPHGGAPMPLPFADRHAVVTPHGLGLYARLDAGWQGRLAALELVVEARFDAGEKLPLRAQPSQAAAADLLEAAGRLGGETLRQVIARREAAFLPTLAALAAPPAAAAPRTALLLLADDGWAARLALLHAAEFESRADRLLVLGEAAAEIAEGIAIRGRVETLTGATAQAALAEAARGDGVLAIDALRLAEAVTAGETARAFADALDAAALSRLLALHAVAGCSPALAESLSRFLRLRAGGGFAPLPRPPAGAEAGERITAHLARLWSARHG